MVEGFWVKQKKNRQGFRLKVKNIIPKICGKLFSQSPLKYKFNIKLDGERKEADRKEQRKQHKEVDGIHESKEIEMTHFSLKLININAYKLIFFFLITCKLHKQ